LSFLGLPIRSFDLEHIRGIDLSLRSAFFERPDVAAETFTTVHSYGSERESISVPVILMAGENSVRLAASIDTVATFCIFRNKLAEALGLDLANATLKRFRTANSSWLGLALRMPPRTTCFSYSSSV
jgi:hypothetical protein